MVKFKGTIQEAIIGFVRYTNTKAEEYKLNYYTPKNENFLLVDPLTYSGIELVYMKNKLKLFTGGVYTDILYKDSKTKFSMESTLQEVFDYLINKEKINSDIFTDIFICLDDYALGGRE